MKGLVGIVAILPCFCNFASSVQYSCGTKFSISRSRSTTRRTAMLCTRPADKLVADFLPQQFGDVVADQPVQNSAGLMSVHQVHVDLARVSEGLLNGGLVISWKTTRLTLAVFHFRRGDQDAMRWPHLRDQGRSPDRFLWRGRHRALSSLTVSRLSFMTRYFGSKSFSTSTESCETSKSRTWPLEALTV